MDADPIKLPENAPAPIDALFERYVHLVHAYVRLSMGRRLRGRESVEDLVQSACLDVLRDARQRGIPDEETFRWWLCRAARQKVLARARYHGAARRTPEREVAGGGDGLERLSACYASVITPSRALSAREQLERLEDAMADLSEIDRAIVLNARLLDVPHTETARELGLTEAAVKTRLHRALAVLSKRL